MVCIKPHGIPSQPDQSGSEDMTSLLRENLRECGENDEIFVVHRLDRTTGGIMLYARNAQASAFFSNLVSQKKGFEKEYLAIVSGKPQEDKGTMTDLLYKDSAQKKAFVVKTERKGAKSAILDFEVLSTVRIAEKSFSLLKILLHTGRFHQIRVQLSSRKMPIYADGKYGSREKAPQMGLWAHRIAFVYKGKKYEFKKDPDYDLIPWNIFK